MRISRENGCSVLTALSPENCYKRRPLTVSECNTAVLYANATGKWVLTEEVNGRRETKSLTQSDTFTFPNLLFPVLTVVALFRWIDPRCTYGLYRKRLWDLFLHWQPLHLPLTLSSCYSERKTQTCCLCKRSGIGQGTTLCWPCTHAVAVHNLIVWWLHHKLLWLNFIELQPLKAESCVAKAHMNRVLTRIDFPPGADWL